MVGSRVKIVKIVPITPCHDDPIDYNVRRESLLGATGIVIEAHERRGNRILIEFDDEEKERINRSLGGYYWMDEELEVLK